MQANPDTFQAVSAGENSKLMERSFFPEEVWQLMIPSFFKHNIR
jgi:hypothetical protein